MSRITSENTFETAIIQSLLESGGYTGGDAGDYSPELGMFKTEVLELLQSTQPRQWEKLSGLHGSDVENRIIQRLYKEIFEKILEDQSFGVLVKELMMKKIYARLNENIK